MVEPIDKWLIQKTDEVTELQHEITTYYSLQEQFPDLSYSIDRWKHFRLHSKSINEIATDVEICHSCGCCPDSPLFARPYILISNVKIYCCETFDIGEKSYDGGDYPSSNWKTKLVDAKIPQEVIDIVEKYFEENKPQEYEDDPEPFI